MVKQCIIMLNENWLTLHHERALQSNCQQDLIQDQILLYGFGSMVPAGLFLDDLHAEHN